MQGPIVLVFYIRFSVRFWLASHHWSLDLSRENPTFVLNVAALVCRPPMTAFLNHWAENISKANVLKTWVNYALEVVGMLEPMDVQYLFG